MQAGRSRDTIVLSSVAIALSALVGCIEATRLSMDLAIYPRPALGDRVVLPAPAAAGPAWSAKAHLPSGKTCELSIGPSGGAGGQLYVVRIDSSGDVSAVWSSTGRSSASGPDCGNGAQVTLDARTFSNLTSAARGVGLPWGADISGEL